MFYDTLGFHVVNTFEFRHHGQRISFINSFKVGINKKKERSRVCKYHDFYIVLIEKMSWSCIPDHRVTFQFILDISKKRTTFPLCLFGDVYSFYYSCCHNYLIHFVKFLSLKDFNTFGTSFWNFVLISN
jgi:hypothetical protein